MSASYASREEAGMAVDVLRDFRILARMEVVETFDVEREVWWEVTIVEVPADYPRCVVERGSEAPSPELDEHDRGKSTWWDRDDNG